MRLFVGKTAALLFSLALVVPCCAGGIRTFGGGSAWPTRPFYGEVVFRVEAKGHNPFRSRSLIWCRDREHYRLELVDWPGDGVRTYSVRSGTRVYSTVARPEVPENARWTCCPVFWIGKDFIEPNIRHEWRMQDPVLVEIGKLHGIRAEHWRGHRESKRRIADNTFDVWLSTDPRFPLVLKVESNNADSILHWEIARLRLGQPIPYYMLTSQVRPRGGLMAQLRMQYKPLWVVLLWYALLLLAFGWLIRALVKGKDASKRALSITGAGLAVLGLLWLSPGTDQYMNQLSGLPVLVLIGGMVAGMLVYWAKRFPIPGDVRLFAGTRWPVAMWTLVAAGVAMLIYTDRAHALASLQFGLVCRGLPFLPQTLVTVLVHAATWAALEEVVFRGYITGLLGRRFSSLRLVNLLQALVFTVEHIPKVLRAQGSYPALVCGLGGIFVFGLVFGSLRLKYRNLGAPWLVHTGYNVGAFYAANAGLYGLLAAVMSI